MRSKKWVDNNTLKLHINKTKISVYNNVNMKINNIAK